MFKVTRFPADATLYEEAKNYVAAVSATWRGVDATLQPRTTTPNTTQPPSNAAFLAAMQRSRFERHANQDILDIAIELCDYAEREAF